MECILGKLNSLMSRIQAIKGKFRGYSFALLLTVLALAVRFVMAPVDAGLQYITFFPAVTLTAFIAGFWAGIFATALGVVFATFIFTFPYYSFSIQAIHNSVWSNAVFMLDGLIVCSSIEAMHHYRMNYAKELEETKRAHEEALRQSRQLQNVFENVLDGIVIFDERGAVRSYNKAAEGIFQYGSADVVGKDVSMLLPEFHGRKGGLDGCQKWIVGAGQETDGRRRDGSTFPMELSVCEISNDERIYTAIMRDISKRKSVEEIMRHLAHHDQLTDLPNRILFADRLHLALSKAKRDNEKIALMFLDLDKFKSINDALGHGVGDLLLKEVATRLQASLRESDTAARLGGDEFVVLLPEVESEKDALQVAQKIVHAIEKPFKIDRHILDVTCSIGIALYPDHGADEDDLIRKADAAMYEAKRTDGNRVTIYCPEGAKTG